MSTPKPVFPAAEHAAAEAAINDLLDDLDRIARTHRDRAADLTSWTGLGRSDFDDDLAGAIDTVATCAERLRADLDALSGHDALYQIALTNWLEAQTDD